MANKKRVVKYLRRLLRRRKNKEDEIGTDLFWPDDHAGRERIRGAFVQFLADLRHQGILFTRYVQRSVACSLDHSNIAQSPPMHVSSSIPDDIQCQSAQQEDSCSVDNLLQDHDKIPRVVGEHLKKTAQSFTSTRRIVNPATGAVPKYYYVNIN